jgi:hemerythrin
MSISWDATLAIDLQDIDQQHKEIVRRLDRMLTAMSQRKGKGEVGPLCAFLSEYVVMHFRAEEQYMAQRSYPEYAAHKSEHDEIVQSFAKMVDDYERNGSTVVTVLRAARCLTDHVRSHMQVTDHKLAVFARSFAA